MESTPEYNFITEGQLFTLRWKHVTLEAVERLGASLRARSEQLGEKLFYVAIIPAETRSLDDATRSALLEGFAQSYVYMETARVVLLGSGFQVTLLRSMLTAMTLASGLSGYPFRVERSPRTAIDAYVKTFGGAPEPLYEKFVREGLVSAEELG